MNAQDIKFLSELKKELLTQPTDGNCDPRFWGVKQRHREYGFDSEYADGWEVYDGENCESVGKPDDIQSVIDEMVSEYEVDKTEFEEHHDDYDYMDISDISDVVLRINQIMRKRSGESTYSSYTPFTIAYYKDFHTVSEDALFLTKKACSEHIERYGYNYKYPHTYVMTAVRCPEYETLLKIIKETDWKADSVPVVHAHWIDGLIEDIPVQVCDNCKTFYPLSYTGGGHHFCPNCGAKMDGKEGE